MRFFAKYLNTIGAINVFRASDHLPETYRHGFRLVILGTFDGYPVGLICIAGCISELSGMLRCTLASGSVMVGTAMGMRDTIRVGKRRSRYMRMT